MRRSALALLLGCLLLVAGASALDGYDYYQTIEYAACDQDVYQQDIVIHRSTGTAYNETAGGLETWHIFVGDHCQADYDDIRFTNSTGELEYYLWPDYNSTYARFAVRLEGADTAGEATMWYGSAAATTTSNGSATYEFFDQFDGATLDAEKWSVSVSQHSVSDGTLKVTRSGTPGGLIHSTQEITSPCVVQARGRATTSGSDAATPIGLKHPTSWSYRAGTISTSSAGHYYFRSTNGGLNEDPIVSLSSITDFRILTIEWLGTTAGIRINGVHYGYNSNQVYSSPQRVVVYGGNADGGAEVDWILVRTYSATPPAALTFSGEQEAAAPPITAFTATPLAGLAPLTVTFTDTSTGGPASWSWSFGDGGTSSTQNPQHTYSAPGTYSVNLTATNEYGSDYELKTNYITVYGPITADFSATPTGGTAPLTVQFTDRSTGGPTSWLWDFGDGNTSSSQNPQHTYTTAGAHTVTLTASHPYDSDTETKTSYITVAVLQPFPGLTNIPRDLTGNGLYTDINGNNRLDYNDLTVFFQHLSWAKTAQPIACFDFNGNGWLDYNDVITLFMTISGGV